MSDTNKTPQGGNEPEKGGAKGQNKVPNAWGKKGNPNNQNPNNGKNKKFQGGTKGLEDNTFYYGPGMDAKFIASKEKVLNFLQKKFSASEKISILNGQLTLVGIAFPKKIKDDAEFKALEMWEQEQWRNEMKRYNDYKYSVHKNLTTCYGIIWDQMTTALQNQLRRDSSFKTIELEQSSPKLFMLLSDICNKSSDVDHFMTRSVESLYGITNLSGNRMSIAEYHKLFVAKRNIAANSGHHFSSTILVAEVTKTKKKKTGWLDTDADFKTWNADVLSHADEFFYATIFLRRSGDRYEEVRRTLKNDFVKGNDNIPMTVEDAYALLQSYQLEPKKNQTKDQSKKVDETDDNPNNKGKYPGHSFQQKDFK